MRTLALVFIAMVVASTFAIQAKAPTAATIKRIEAMSKNNKSWSSVIMSLAMLNAKAGNPLDELIAAIEKVIADLDAKTDNANRQYDQRTGEHNSEVKRLQREIDNANADIAHTEQFLKEVLYVMKNNLEQDIVTLQDNIAQTRKFLETAAVQRQVDHEDYTVKVTEFDNGISACTEAFGVLTQLLEGGVSLA
jgi:predicted  nucleic acid-binding Zn-ribbon protein